MSVRRLFVNGPCGSSSFRYVMADNKAEAERLFGGDARTPDSDDMRFLWMRERLHEKTPDEIQALFGITRQALSLWRKKAGADIPRRREHLKSVKQDAVLRALKEGGGEKTALDVAGELGVSPELVKEVAALAGLTLANRHQKKPDDDEIVRLSVGKTWRELAEACGVTLATLRNYIYGKPALSAAVREGIVYEQTGQPSHGRIDVDRLVAMYTVEGKTPYRIAEEFGTQNLTVIYWLKKLGIYRGAVSE